MPALTPSFVFDLESRMRYIVESEYNRLAQNRWVDRVIKRLPSGNKKERISWLLSTMKIDRQLTEGTISFEDIVALTKEYENEFASAGLKLRRSQLEDLDSNGIDLATHWASQAGAYGAYWPQKMTAEVVVAGEGTTRGTAYDALAYFHNAHLSNPFDASGFTYANLLTGVAASTPSTDPNDAIYPGACPIDSSVTVDVAYNNLAKAMAYIRSIKMPNGKDPRHLKPSFMLVPPSLVVRAQQLTNARYIAQAAASGGGSGDVESIIYNWGMGSPVEVLEFAADPTSYYIAVEEMGSSQLGAILYIDREPFRVTYYTGSGGGTGVDAVLDRARELEWHIQGRNVTTYGHPYLLHKVKAT